MGTNPDDWELEEGELGTDVPYPSIWIWILCSPVALVSGLAAWIHNHRPWRKAK